MYAMIHRRSRSIRRSARRGLVPVATLCLLPFAGGCFTFTPIETGDIQPGMSVRARISPGAAERIAPLLGVSDARIVTGKLVAITSDTLIVEAQAAAAPDATAVGEILHQRVSISRGDLRGLESRTLDRKRTGLVAGAGAAIIVVMLLKVLHGDPAMSSLPGGPGTEDLIPALLRR